jgi:ribosomal protein L36
MQDFFLEMKYLQKRKGAVYVLSVWKKRKGAVYVLSIWKRTFKMT